MRAWRRLRERAADDAFAGREQFCASNNLAATEDTLSPAPAPFVPVRSAGSARMPTSHVI